MTPAPPGTPLDGALQRLAGTDVLLACVDFDGTLAPIVATPDRARALPDAAAALTALSGLPRTHTAIVSGRARADLTELAGLAGIPGTVHLVGSHGAELPEALGAVPPTDAATRARVRDLVAAVEEVTTGTPGVLLETKPTGIAVHVRLAARGDAARVLEDVRGGPGRRDGVHLTAGHEVLELSVVRGDKGDALDALRATTGATAVLFVGDDVTDERALARLGRDDVGVRVGPGSTRAPFRVGGPADVAALLETLAAARGRLSPPVPGPH